MWKWCKNNSEENWNKLYVYLLNNSIKWRHRSYKSRLVTCGYTEVFWYNIWQTNNYFTDVLTLQICISLNFNSICRNEQACTSQFTRTYQRAEFWLSLKRSNNILADFDVVKEKIHVHASFFDSLIKKSKHCILLDIFFTLYSFPFTPDKQNYNFHYSFS